MKESITKTTSLPPIVEAMSDTYMFYRCGLWYVVKAENKLRAMQMVCEREGFTQGDLEEGGPTVVKKVEYGEVQIIDIRGPKA
jgi:hypothetical protein